MRKLTLIFILLISLLCLGTPVKAHDITTKALVLVNGQNLLIENQVPMTSKLTWSQHIINQNFTPGEVITLKFDIDTAVRELNFDSTTTTVTWETSNGQKFNGPETKISFEHTGSYFIAIQAEDKQQHIYDEVLEMTVGIPIFASRIKISDPETLVDPKSPIVQINRRQSYTFSPVEIDESKYTYVWDLADTDVIEHTSVTKSFENTKLPAYIVLRTINKATNVFADSYVRLESNTDPDFRVVMPSAPQNNETVPQSNSNIFIVVGVIVLIGIVGSLGLKLYQRTKSNHKS